MESERDRLLEIASSLIPDPPAERNWVAGDWHVSSPTYRESTSTEGLMFESNKDLPRSSIGNAPVEGRAFWVAFKVSASRKAQLWLAFNSGPGSRVLVNGREVAHVNAPGPEKLGVASLLEIEPGEASIEFKVVGSAVNDQLSVWVEDAATMESLATMWQAADVEERLSLVAHPNGPLNHFQIQHHITS